MDAKLDQLEHTTRRLYAQASEGEHLLRQLLVLLEKISADNGFDQLSSAIQDVTEAAKDQLAGYLEGKVPQRSAPLH